jgi:putative acetyltransferase
MIETLSRRPYAPSDRETVSVLHALAFEKLAAALHSPAEIAAHTALTQSPEYGEDLLRSNVVLAIDGNGAVVATAGWIAVPEEPGTARIRKVFVDPTLARRGIGSSMVVDAERRAAAHGYPGLIVRANLNAVPLYASLGYAPIREGRMPTPSGVALPVVFMEKRRPAQAD